MAKIIAYDTLKDGVSLQDVLPHLAEEARHAWDSYCKGVFRELYMRTDRPGAVIVLECEDVEEARAVMAELPLVKAGLIEFQFLPVGPFLPWGELFAPRD